MAKRMTSIVKKIGLICYHIIPAAFLFFVIGEISIGSIFDFLFLMIAFYALYEIGYIYNDTETVKTENNPTLRLSDDEIAYYNKRKINIYIDRCLIFLLLTFVPIVMFHHKYLLLGFIACILELFIFQLYNNIRGRFSIPVFFLLETFKYLPFVICFYDRINSIILGVVMLIYAIPNTIERLSFPRYDIKLMMKLLPSRQSLLIFRGGYNITIAIILYCLDLLKLFPNSYFLLFFFLAFFRGFALIAEYKKGTVLSR